LGIIKMQVEVKGLEKHKKSLSIEVPKEEVEKRLSEAYTKVADSVFVPGFRKGKAPLKILKLYYGKEVKGQIKEELIEEYYNKTINEKDVKVASEPEIKNVELEDGKPMKFEVIVEVFPEFKIGKYKGIEVEKKKVEVTDEDVESVLERKREEHAQLIPVKNRPSQKGDLITVDYQVQIDNKVAREMKSQSLILGKTSLPKEWESALTGVKKGDTREVKTKAKGKDTKKIVYKFTVQDVQERSLLVLTDDFAKKLGDFDSLDKLREKIREELGELARLHEEEHLKDEILNKIIKNSDIEVPSSMVEKFSEYYKVINQNLGEEESEKLAKEAIKKQLIVDEIAKKEKIEVTDEELKKRKSEVTSGKKSEEDLQDELKREKVMKFLIDNAKIKSKEKRVILTPEEASKLSSKKRFWPRKGRIITPGGQR
jgi:trigger factor